MKELISIFFVLTAISLQAQIPERDFYIAASEKADKLDRIYEDWVGVKRGDEETTHKDYYYDPDKGLFVVTCWLSSLPKNRGEVKRAEYVLIWELEVEISRNKKGKVKTKTVKDETLSSPEELEAWWRHQMETYEDPKFGRDEAAEKYGMASPPPPLPQKESWKDN